MLILVTLLWLLPSSHPALAHALHVFAAAEGARISGSAYFAGGARASGAQIRITDATGKVLARLTPAADGSFSYQATAPVEHRVIAESNDGHRAEWRIQATELAGAFPAAAGEAIAGTPIAGTPIAGTRGTGAPGTGEPSTPEPGAGSGDTPLTAATPTAVDQPPLSSAAVDAQALEATFERLIARQIRPLREELLATRDALRLQDILGGIGYIVGLAGLALWWQARKPGGRD